MLTFSRATDPLKPDPTFQELGMRELVDLLSGDSVRAYGIASAGVIVGMFSLSYFDSSLMGDKFYLFFFNTAIAVLIVALIVEIASILRMPIPSEASRMKIARLSLFFCVSFGAIFSYAFYGRVARTVPSSAVTGWCVNVVRNITPSESALLVGVVFVNPSSMDADVKWNLQLGDGPTEIDGADATDLLPTIVRTDHGKTRFSTADLIAAKTKHVPPHAYRSGILLATFNSALNPLLEKPALIRVGVNIDSATPMSGAIAVSEDVPKGVSCEISPGVGTMVGKGPAQIGRAARRKRRSS